MVDFCKGVEARWGVALARVEQTNGKARLVIVDTGAHEVIVNSGAMLGHHAHVHHLGLLGINACTVGGSIWVRCLRCKRTRSLAMGCNCPLVQC